MEPMVKADTLANSLLLMTEYLARLETMVVNFSNAQMAFNSQVGTELNISPFYGAPTITDPKNPAQLGKTALETWNNITEEGRRLRTEISTFAVSHLGIAGSEGIPWKERVKKRINYSTFASKHHFLD
jgi:hypothetical protein